MKQRVPKRDRCGRSVMSAANEKEGHNLSPICCALNLYINWSQLQYTQPSILGLLCWISGGIGGLPN